MYNPDSDFIVRLQQSFGEFFIWYTWLMLLKFLSVDFQKDFTSEDGAHYMPGPSVSFIKQTFVPYLRENNIRVAEIVSDYRQPRPGRRGDFCKPGTKGYESEIPKDVRQPSVWVKAANTPLWTRENAGIEHKEPGIPYEDPARFSAWLSETIGAPSDVDVVVVGLTLDRCVLCTVQELYMRGYKTMILEEATDPASGDPVEKDAMLRGAIINNWSVPVSWNTLQEELRQGTFQLR